jgi:hypothetical protein
MARRARRARKAGTKRSRSYGRKTSKRGKKVVSKKGNVFAKTRRGTKKIGKCRRRGRRWIK